MTPSGIEPATFRFVVQHLNHCATAVTHHYYKTAGEWRQRMYFYFYAYVFLMLCLCNTIVCLCIFIMPAGTLRLPRLRGFPCFFLSCKANARVKPAKTGHGPHSSKIFVLFYVLFVLCHSVHCLCVNVYCTSATGWQPNCS